jgi:hypothetical protein
LVLVIWLSQLILADQFHHQGLDLLGTKLSSKQDKAELSVFWQRQQFFIVKNFPQFPLRLSLAKTTESRALGLGEQAQLLNDGMLFLFDQPAKWQFWMKEMNFPLDFVWLIDGMVVEISQDVQPPALAVSVDQKNESLSILTPRQNINQVVELAAGRVKTLDIRVGDRILIQD